MVDTLDSFFPPPPPSSPFDDAAAAVVASLGMEGGGSTETALGADSTVGAVSPVSMLM